VPEPGIPNVNNGTNDPVQAALLALSGAANLNDFVVGEPFDLNFYILSGVLPSAFYLLIIYKL